MPINREIKISMDVEAKTQKAQEELQKLSKQLDSLMKNSKTSSSGLGISLDLDKSIAKVRELKQILESSRTSTGQLDLGKMNQSLKASKTSLQDYSKILNSLGPEGASAFQKIATQITSAETNLKRTNRVLQEFKVTLMNTAKWQISSTVLHGFIGSVQSAFHYAENLNESLNNIRIVTGHNSEYMAQFAKTANEAAQALSASTTAYTDAALIYYQQGLSDDEVKKRTDATIQMVHATGDSATEVSSYMTAIWNNFYDGSESVEHFGDVIAALGASTASSSSEIASGLQQFAAIAETTGLSYDYATSSLATLVANTRQSADTVGTALKTIFSRIQGVKLGETLEDGVDLNKYSKALKTIGVDILDVNGEMKDMDPILQDIADSWQGLSQAQQMATAQTVAGVRQYTYFMSLMNNWDDMQANLNTAANADGTLEEQSNIYQESWEAARDRVKAALQEIYDQLLNDDFFITMNDGFAKMLNFISDLIEGLNGLPGVLSLVSSMMFKAFGPEMAAGLRNIGDRIKNLNTSPGQELKNDAYDSLKQSQVTSLGSGHEAEDIAVSETAQKTGVFLDGIRQKEEAILSQKKTISEEDQRNLDLLKQQVEYRGKAYTESAKQLDSANELLSNASARAIKEKDINAIGLQNSAELTKNTAAYKTVLNALDQQIDKSDDYKDNIQEIYRILSDTSKNLREQGLDEAADKVKALKQRMKKEDPKEVVASFQRDAENQNVRNTEHFDNLDGDREQIEAVAVASEHAGSAAAQAAIDQGNLNSAIEQGNEARDNMKGQSADMSQGLVALGQAFSSVAMIGNSVYGLFKTWSNDDMSIGEKLLTTFTTLGMIIPQIITLTESLTLAKEAHILVSLKENAVVIASKIKEIALTTQQNIQSGISIGLKIKEAVATGGLVAAQEALNVAMEANPIGAIIAAFVALIAILAGVTAGVIYLVNNVFSAGARANKELENAQATANELSEALEEAESSANALKTAFDSYDSAVDKLNQCTKGTEEWNEALQDVNNQVLELIGQYPELAQYVSTDEDGLMSISKKGQTAMKQAANERVAVAQAASVEANQNVRDKEIEVQKQDLRESLNGQGLSVSDRALLEGAINSGNIDKDAMAKFGEINLGDEANELISAIEANTSATEAESKALAQTALQNDETTQKSENKEEIIAASGAAYDAIYESKLKELESSGYGKEGISKGATESNQTAQQVFEDYLKASGISGTLTGVTGTDNNRQFVYNDEEGNEKQVSLEAITNTIAASEANAELANKTEFLDGVFTDLGAHTDHANDALIGFAQGTGSLLDGTTQEIEDIRAGIKEAGSTKKYVNETFGGEDGKLSDDEALAMGYDSAQDFIQAFDEGLDGFDEAAEDLGKNWSNATKKLMEDSGIKDESLETQKQMGSQIEELNNKGQGGTAELLSSMFSEAGKDGEKFSQTLKDINWDTASVASLSSALEEAGVSADFTNESLNSLILGMREVSESDPLDFQSLHGTIDGLSDGATLSADKFAELDSSMQQYFQQTLDGNYILIESAQKLKNELSQLEEASYVNDMLDKQAKVDANESYSKKEDGGTRNLGRTAGESDYDFVDDQLKYLEALNEGDDKLSKNIEKWQRLNNDAREAGTSTEEYAEKVAKATEKLHEGSESTKELNEELEASKEALQAYQEESFLETLDDDAPREKVVELADAYEETGKAIDETYDRMNALQDAEADLRVNDAVEDLASNWEDYADVIKNVQKATKKSDKALEMSSDTADQMKETLADLINVNEDLIDTNFVDALDPDDLEAAANGDEEAIQRIRDAFVDAQAEAYNCADGVDAFKSYMDGLQDGEAIDLSLDDTEFINNLVAAQLAAGATAEDIQSTLQGMGISVDVAPLTGDLAAAQSAVEGTTDAIIEAGSIDAEANVQNIEQTSTKEDVGFDEEITTEQVPSKGDSVAEGSGASTVPIQQQLTEYHKTVTPKTESAEETKNTALTGVKLSSARKSAGGNVSSNNKGTRRSSGGGGGRRGSGRSGRGRSYRIRKSDLNKKSYKDERTRYYDIDHKIDDINDKLTKYDSIADRAFGKKRLAALKETVKQYKALADATNIKLEEAKSYQTYDIEKANKYGWKTDENGNITNYDAREKELYQMWNAAEDKYYNALEKAKTDKQKEAAEEARKKAQKYFEDAMKAAKQLDETNELIEDLEQEYRDNIAQLIDAKLEAIEYTVEVKIELQDDDLKLLEGLFDQLGDGADKAVDKISLLGGQILDIGNKIDITKEGINDLLSSFTDTDIYGDTALGEDVIQRAMSGTLTEADYEAFNNLKSGDGVEGLPQEVVDQLRDYEDDLIDYSGELLDKQEEAVELVGDAFDEYNDKLDENAEKIEHLQSVSQAYKDIIDIVGKRALDASGELSNQLSRANWDLQRNNTHALRSQLDFLEQSMAGYQAKIAELEASNDGGQYDDTIKRLKDKLNEAEEAFRDTTENFNDSWVAEMQAAADIYAETLDTIVTKFSDSVAGALTSLDELSDLYDRQSEIGDIYVDDFQKIHDLTALTRDINNSIDDTDNINSKKALRDLLKEVNELQEEGVQLSEYDIENARRRYELELAKQALENAKAVKSVVRMNRDSEGNYGYVYTADEDAVSEAEQNYEDKLYEIQRANADYIEELENNIMSAEQECMSAIENLDASQFASHEEYMAAVNQIQEDYQALRDGYFQQFEGVLENNKQLYENEWQQYSDLTGYKISADENYVDSFDETTLSLLTGFGTIEEAQDAWANAVADATSEAADAWFQWRDDNETALSDGQSSMDDYSDTVAEVISNLEEQGTDIETSAEQISEAYATAFENILDAIEQFATDYDTYVQERIIATNTALLESINTLIAKSSELNDKTTATELKNSTRTSSGSSNRSSRSRSRRRRSRSRSRSRSRRSSSRRSSSRRSSSSSYSSNRSSSSSSRRRTSSRRRRSSSRRRRRTSFWRRVGRAVRRAVRRAYRAARRAAKRSKRYDTGGYTGDWGSSEGRLAVLHQKELVLNKQDTSNILSAVDTIREISKTIDLNALAASNGLSSSLDSTAYNSSTNSNDLNQNVSITAEFPNATDRNEIEAAFDNLINRASQFANRK